MKLRVINEAAAGGSGGPGLPGALNMGIDEAIVTGLAAGHGAELGLGDGEAAYVSAPTLRFYRWSPACVTIGYFQSMAEEIDLEACALHGIDAVRRVTGGGAVFHDAEITYSLIVPEASALAPDDILESYARICGGLVAGLRGLGVDAAFAPINDIQVGGRKVSGNAQTRRRGCLLQHGTILLGLDVERMFSILKVPAEKLKGRLIEDAKARVTSLEALLGRRPGFDEAAAALLEGFAQAWADRGIEFEAGGLSSAELAAAARLAESKYGRSEWNLKR